MANIFDCIFSAEKAVTLKYYGDKDFTTGWDIKRLLENADKILNYYKSKEINGIDSFDEYIDFLFLRKMILLQDSVGEIMSDDNKALALKVIDDLLKIEKKYDNADVIRFINDQYKEIFDHHEKYYDLHDVTLELCAKYQTGIEDDAFLFLAQERPYLLIYHYGDFQKRIEKSSKIVVSLFNSIVKDKNYRHNLQPVLGILQSIFIHKPSLFENLSDSVETIINLGVSIANQSTKENIIYYERQFNAIYEFLKNIRNVRANKFAEYKIKIDELLKQYIIESGSTFSYEFPTDKIKQMLENDIPWDIKLIYITHSKSKNGSTIISNLSNPPQNKHPIIDLVSTNRPTNDYFTLSHQNALDITLTVGGFTIFLMLSDKKLFDESLACLSGIVDFICEASRCTSCDIDQDFRLLVQMLNNVFYSTIQGDTDNQVMQSLCYGTAMFICSFTEKLLRSIYISLKRNELYIPVNKATLGELFSSENDLFKAIFGEYQLKHLNYFFCTEKGKENLGYNFRNRLAHWNDISNASLTRKLVSNLFYLLLAIINSLYLYFSINASVLTGEDEQNDQL